MVRLLTVNQLHRATGGQAGKTRGACRREAIKRHGLQPAIGEWRVRAGLLGNDWKDGA
ncbi:MAG: hypothetical protein QNJ48_05705 [Desulfobacterales bacterium]|nr:hypothetical protein [Desulfobacterales bacterium]